MGTLFSFGAERYIVDLLKAGLGLAYTITLVPCAAVQNNKTMGNKWKYITIGSLFLRIWIHLKNLDTPLHHILIQHIPKVFSESSEVGES